MNSVKDRFALNYLNTGLQSYRFSFQGQEMDNEVKGNGNSYTAQFWQYDPRLGRRWNVDPVNNPSESSYSTNRNNPVVKSDPNGDCPDCPDPDVNASANVSLSFNFGTKGQSNFSFGAGIGLSANYGNFMGGLNLSARLYGGGLGTTGTTDGQTGINMDFVASPSLTVGKGTATSRPLSTFNEGTFNLTGVQNSYKTSFSGAINYVNGEFNQKVGSLGFRTDNLSVNIYNDIFPGGDKDDRGWTGGGGADLYLGNGNSIFFGTEVFTGERIKLDKPDPKTGIKYETYEFNGRSFYTQNERGYALTNGQTFLQYSNSMGVAGKLSLSGMGVINSMYSQNSIHDTFSAFGRFTPRFQSTAPQSVSVGGSLSTP